MPSRFALQLARKINRMWVRCAKGKVAMSDCPSDDAVAEVIDKALTSKSDAKK